MAPEIAPNGVPALVSKGLGDHESEPVIATVAALADVGTAIDPAMIDAAARAWSANTKPVSYTHLTLPTIYSV